MNPRSYACARLIPMGLLVLASLSSFALADGVDTGDAEQGIEASEADGSSTASDTQPEGSDTADSSEDGQEADGSASTAEPSSTNSLVQAQQEFDAAQAQLQEIGSQLEDTQSRIHDTQTDLDQIDAQIVQTKQDITDTENDLAVAQNALAAYLQITYKSGVLSFLDVILASNDFNDFVTRTYYASAVQNSQVETINEIKDLKAKLIQLQSDLTEQQSTETALLAQLEEQETQLSEQKAQSDAVVAQLSAQVQELFAQQQANLAQAASARAVAAGAAQSGEEQGVYNVGVSQGSITADAYACLGMPYVWGGDDSNYSTYLGYDCSGFAQHCYALEGYSIGRTTWDQIDDIQAAGDWKTSIDELEPGDLVFPSDSHVGIYIGNGQMIDAPYPGVYIRIDTITSFIGGGSPIAS